MEANGRLQRFDRSNKCLWPQCLIEVPHLRWSCGRSAWCRQARGIWSVLGVLGGLGVLGVLRVASGRLERPNNRGLWRQWTQTAGCNALIEMPVARVPDRSSTPAVVLWPECLVQAGARDLECFRGFRWFRGFRGFTGGKRQA